MNKESIYEMMLDVLDAPTECRIIVKTCYPDFNNNIDNEITDAYFMIDRSDGGDVYDAETKERIQSAVVYDHWQVSDSLGQVRDFKTNKDLMDFFVSIEKIYEDAYIESF